VNVFANNAPAPESPNRKPDELTDFKAIDADQVLRRYKHWPRLARGLEGPFIA
jgi:hypothetical protein